MTAARPLTLRGLALVARPLFATLMVGLGLAAAGRLAQAAEDSSNGRVASSSGRGLWIAPSLSLETSIADLLSEAGNRSTQTTLNFTPALRLTQRSGRVTGNLFFSASFIDRRNPDLHESRLQKTLDGSVQAEVFPGWGFFNAQATITQQPTTGLARNADAETSSVTERTEIRTLRLSPYVEGRLGSLAEYQGRLDRVDTHSTSALYPDSYSNQLSGRIGSPRGVGRLGWAVFGSSLTSNFSGRSRSATTDQVGGQISVTPDIDWQFSARAGVEYSDVATAERTRYANVGAGVQWTPSPRTRASLDLDKRYFGRSHRLALEHRLARTTFRYSDGRDVINGLDSRGYSNSQTLYQLWSNQLAAIQPDPGLRDQLVRDLIRAQGRDPNELVSGAFLVPGITVQRRQELSVSLLGARLTAAATAYRSNAKRIDDGAASLPGGTEPTVQSGYSANVGWRLTPLASATIGLTRQHIDQGGLGTSANTSVLANVSQQVGRRLNATVGLRRTNLSRSNGALSSGQSRETALNALLSLTF